MKPSKKQVTYSQLSRDERTLIESLLNKNCSIKSIARDLGRSPSTISREIKNHIKFIPQKESQCTNKSSCTAAYLCKSCTSSKKMSCKKCLHCTSVCPDFKPYKCETILNSPYVCNACNHKGICKLEKRIYRASFAQNEYEINQAESRSGFDMSEADITVINELVTPLIKKGQSPYHIKQTLGDKIPCSEATLRRIINSSRIEARNLDLRVQVKRKQRKRRTKEESIRIQEAKKGHMYDDYQRIMEHDPDMLHVEMDCVEGLKSDKAVFLTLYFPDTHIQLALVLDEHTSDQVVKALDKIEESLGTELFRSMFPIILTDNGHEFTDIEGIERSIFGGKRTTVYYCEPNRSEQKGGCERNHEILRYIFPKGTSLENVTQEQLTLAVNHMNSQIRKSIGGKCPYELAHFLGIPDDFFILLGLEQIPAEQVCLKPKLLK